MWIDDGDSMTTNLLQLSPKPRNLILQIFIQDAATNRVRRRGPGGVNESGGDMLCLMLLRLLMGHVIVPTKAKVLRSIRLGRDETSSRNRASSLVQILLLGMRLLLPVLFLG